jgi:steroid delta-isomerase-like uncharacterized protein
MMSDSIKLAQSMVDAYNNQDVEAYLNMIAEDVDIMWPEQETPMKSELREEFLEIIEGVPDRHFDVTRIVATEKGALIECILKGKNTGPLFGNPPTNNEFAVPMIHVYDFEDDKINRWRCYANFQILTQQLMGE